jgi:hypothetical protein
LALGVRQLQPVGRCLAGGAGDHVAAELVKPNQINGADKLPWRLAFEHLDRLAKAGAEAVQEFK